MSTETTPRTSRRPWPVRALTTVGHEVFVRPVRDGRLRSDGWPPGLWAAVSLSVVAYLALMGLVVVSGLVQARWPLESPVGIHVVGMVGGLGGLCMVIALGVLAAAELRTWRIGVLAICTIIIVGQAAPLLTLREYWPGLFWGWPWSSARPGP